MYFVRYNKFDEINLNNSANNFQLIWWRSFFYLHYVLRIIIKKKKGQKKDK